MATGLQRGAYPAKSLHLGDVTLVGGMIGAGAAVLTASLTLAAKDNLYSSNTRTSTGLFVVTMKEMPAIVLDITINIFNASGTTLFGTVRSWSTSAKTITIDVRDGASSSAVADPTTSDHLRIVVKGRNSTA